MPDPVPRLNASLAGRYRIEREVGRGGMATVYLAEDLRHRRGVALKVLKPDLGSMVGPERFLREIQIAARLRHPHILPLLDSGEADGLLYYAMPFVEGESLRDRLKHEKQLPIEEAIHIAGEVADALAYSHGQGVIHRDIKSSNILLDSGHAVVADFGIALMLYDVAPGRLTASGITPGSPLYMSPEQVTGDQLVDGRSDIYSLGCVLYEMLCGDPPFSGSVRQAVLAKKLVEPIPGLRVVRDTVPVYLERVVLRALARTPADRFKSADEFRQALVGRADGSQVGVDWPVGIESAETGASIGRPSPSGGLVLASTAAAVVLMTGIGFLTTRVYDDKLVLPPEYTPSRVDFPLVGLQALIPVLFYAFVAFSAYVAAKYLWRLFALGLRRVPRAGESMDSLRGTWTDAGRKIWDSLSPTTIAESFFLAATGASVIAVLTFRELIAAIRTSETEVLSCLHRSLHFTYTLSLTLLILALIVGRHRVFGGLRLRAELTGRIGAARWGSMGCILFLLMIVTMPWRLLFDNEHSRIRVNGARAYVLVETEAELVIYGAETGATERLRKGGDLRLDHLGTDGYLFEGLASFDAGRDARCIQ